MPIKKNVLILLSKDKRMQPILQNEKPTTMATLKYTSREINRNFRVKVSGIYEGHKVNTLVGVSGLTKMVNDVDLTNRLLDRAFATMNDVCVCKLRRGIKISFYVA